MFLTFKTGRGKGECGEKQAEDKLFQSEKCRFVGFGSSSSTAPILHNGSLERKPPSLCHGHRGWGRSFQWAKWDKLQQVLVFAYSTHQDLLPGTGVGTVLVSVDFKYSFFWSELTQMLGKDNLEIWNKWTVQWASRESWEKQIQGTQELFTVSSKKTSNPTKQ